MNLSEFKSWFEGFSEGIEDRPTKKQWERIKARADEIVPQATPLPVFIDRYRYLPAYWHWNPAYVGGWTTSNSLSNNVAQSTLNSLPSNGLAGSSLQCNNMSSTDTIATPAAMFADLGRADFEAAA